MNHPSWKQPLVTEEPFVGTRASFATTPWRRRSNGKEPPMTARFTCFSAAAICAWSSRCSAGLPPPASSSTLTAAVGSP